VVDPATGNIIAGVRKLPRGGFADTMTVLRHNMGGLKHPGNTVIGAVATNGRLSKEACNKVAQMAHNGLAQTIRPAHTMFDGDTLFALATGTTNQPADTTLIGAFAANMVAQATIDAIRQATSLAGVPAAGDE
jgi:L-aminopeptidase/D-esterase-like protein